MNRTGKPQFPTAEESAAIEPTIRREMAARGATEISISFNRIAGLQATGNFPMEKLPSLRLALFQHGIIPVQVRADTLGFAVRR